jgi:hypothetical protein
MQPHLDYGKLTYSTTLRNTAPFTFVANRRDLAGKKPCEGRACRARPGSLRVDMERARNPLAKLQLTWQILLVAVVGNDEASSRVQD